MNKALRENLQNEHRQLARNFIDGDFNEELDYKTLYRGEKFSIHNKDIIEAVIINIIEHQQILNLIK